MSENSTPNPGTKEAIAADCKCPVIDNCHGAGAYNDENGKPLFWINGNCPIHGNELAEEAKDER